MAVINTGLLTKGLRSTFFQRYHKSTEYWRRVCTMVQSKAASESYAWLGSVPQMREWGTGRLARGLNSESYDVENLKYEATIEVDRDEISDDQTGQIQKRVEQLADAAARHKDYLLGQLVENGGTAGYLAYDGKVFFADDHEWGDSGAQTNQTTYNAGSPTNPDAAEVVAAIARGMKAMMILKDDRGQVMNRQPREMVCLVGPDHYVAFLSALQTAVIPQQYGSSVDNMFRGRFEVIPLPALTDASKWYLCEVGDTVRPFIFQDREPIEFNMLGPGSEEEFKREKYYFGVRARYNMTYGEWLNIVSVDFT